MTPNRRILLNIIATYGRSLYALVCGLFISRWVLAALGKTDFGLYGVAGGMTGIALAVCVMRRGYGGIAAMMNVRQTYTVEHIQKGLTLLNQVRYSAAYPTMRRRKLCFRRGAARSAPEGTARGRARSVCCGGKRKRLRQSSVTLLLPE